ncbi:MAG: Phosphoribosylaminoimidazole (AIR) synthetase [Parcubacteria group bacterium GW2011_GWA2_47_16]|nr:MAG: Phosphoribosylaminoimidazole (AIR) synthetase [Parcubacteria group bacterium GW2011_GWA2_47_16]
MQTTVEQRSEYAQAGVDYRKIKPFKQAMIRTAQRTVRFPNKRDVFVSENLLHAHGGVFWYAGGNRPHMWCQTTEGLGNKNWIAEWMAQFAGTGKSYYKGIPIDTALMAANDCIAQGAMPVAYTDEVAAGQDSWFMDANRAADIGEGFYEVCEAVGMALVQGESPALKYLINALPPVTSAPSFSGCVTGIIVDPDKNLVTGKKMGATDVVVGLTASGLHANGISLVIKRALGLKEEFLAKLPNGNTLGDEALIPTRSYVRAVEEWQLHDLDIHALVPGTGGGIAKLAFDERPFTYRIHDWPKEIPQLFLFMQELGVSIMDILTTFNWGIGYYAIFSKTDGEKAAEVARKAGYDALIVGRVEEGERQVIFGPEGDLVLPPPAD